MSAAKGKCACEGCENSVFARGLCRIHYDRRRNDLKNRGITHTLESLSRTCIRPRMEYGRRKVRHVKGWHIQPLPPLEGLDMEAYTPGRIITEDDLHASTQREETPAQPVYLDGEGTGPSGLGVTVPAPSNLPQKQKGTRKDVEAHRREALHRAISATLEVLHTFYSQLRELDS